MTRYILQFHGLLVGLLLIGVAHAAPVSTSPVRTFAGQYDFVTAAQTLRTADDNTNACSVSSSGSTNLSGIPAGATIVAAYLYWAGSGYASDFTVQLNGSSVSLDAQYLETISTERRYFSGVSEVSGIVTGNGSYTLSNLTVDTSDSYCNVNGVLAGFAIVVVYERAIEPLRTINFFEGFQNFWGSSITLAPTNFRIPPTAIDGKLGILSWEGDSGNSQTRNGVSENLIFDGQSTASIALTDTLNPLNNQFNSTVNTSGTSNTYGVDFDTYDISSRLQAGDTSATTTYQSGQDRVFLSLEVISVTNTPVANLSLVKSHVGNFAPGSRSEFSLTAVNGGPSPATGTSISDSLPVGLSYAGFSSLDPAWSCTNGATVTCSAAGTIAVGASSSVTIEVDVALNATGSLTNTASVTANEFDINTADNVATDSAVIVTPDYTTSGKTILDVNGGPMLPGELVRFDINIVDTANATSAVNLLDNLSGLLTDLTVLDAAGGTDNSSGSQLDIQGIPVLPGQTSTVSFTARVLVSAVTGDVISNTATITDPNTGSTANVTSLDLMVQEIGPASGIKPLYLGDIQGSVNTPSLPMNMSRTPLTSNSTPAVRVRIRRNEDDRQWLLTPALTSPLGLDSTTIPVRLLMRRSNNNSNRLIRVTVDYVGAGSGFIGCSERTLSGTSSTGLSNSVTREFNFNIVQTDANCTPITGVPLTLPTGVQLRLTVDNAPGSN